MPTSTKVKNLNINELTEAQYDAAVQGGVIGANELSVLTDVDYVEPSDLATVATTGDYSDLINRPTNLVSTNTAQTISGMKTFSGDITLSGTTSIKNNTGGTNYTMMYRDASTIHVGASTSVLKLEGSGTRPAYNNDSLALLSDVTGGLPDQTGNAGKFLTTDGTDASWSDKPLVNVATGTNSLAIGPTSVLQRDNCVILGSGASATDAQGTVVGQGANSAFMASAFGYRAKANASYAIQLGANRTNSDSNTFKVANANGNFEMMSADGTIPEARLADTTNAQQGYVLTLDSTGNAVWQAGGSGGGLPSQTGNAGKFLTTDGTNASWANALQNTATSTDTIAVVRGNANINSRWSVIFNTNRAHSSNSAGSIVMGYYAQSTSGYALVFGYSADVSGYQGMAFGYNASVSGRHSIQFGNGENSEDNTLKVSFGDSSDDPNYTLLSADGTIPSARLIKVNTTVTLAAADWSSNTQTVNVTGMTADGIVMVGPAPADHSEYTSAGIYCTAQASGTLTFTCDSEPAGDIDVNVVML